MKIYVKYVRSYDRIKVTRDIDRYYQSLNEIFVDLFNRVKEG